MTPECDVTLEELEDLARGATAEAQTQQLHVHLQSCAVCRTRFELLSGFVGGLRRAFSALASVPLYYLHLTESGLVRVSVERVAAGWRAVLCDEPLEPVFAHVAAANEAAIAAFTRLFPEHRCTAACAAEPRRSTAGSVSAGTGSGVGPRP